jgi:hypothetical protein
MPTINPLHLGLQEIGRKAYLLLSTEEAPADLSAFRTRFQATSALRSALQQDFASQHQGAAGYAALHLLGRNRITYERVQEELVKMGVPADRVDSDTDKTLIDLEDLSTVDDPGFPEGCESEDDKRLYVALGILNGRALAYCDWAGIQVPLDPREEAPSSQESRASQEGDPEVDEEADALSMDYEPDADAEALTDDASQRSDVVVATPPEVSVNHTPTRSSMHAYNPFTPDVLPTCPYTTIVGGPCT